MMLDLPSREARNTINLHPHLSFLLSD
jgi:hypothetical protein